MHESGTLTKLVTFIMENDYAKFWPLIAVTIQLQSYGTNELSEYNV